MGARVAVSVLTDRRGDGAPGRLLDPVPDRLGRGFRTAAPVLRVTALYEPAQHSAAVTPADTADDSSASWTLLSAPTMGCPRNRVKSTPQVRLRPTGSSYLSEKISR